MKGLLIFWLLLGVVCGGLALAGWQDASHSQKRACQPAKRRPEKRRPRLQKYLVLKDHPTAQDNG